MDQVPCGKGGVGVARVYREEALDANVKRGGLNYFLGQAVSIVDCSG